MKARITYSVTTHESAEQGDHSEHGWWLPGGWEHALEDCDGRHEDVLEAAKSGEFDLPLSQAIAEGLDLGCGAEAQQNGTDFTLYSVDPPGDRAFIEDGESRTYCLHIEAGTPLRARLLRSYLEGKDVRFH